MLRSRSPSGLCRNMILFWWGFLFGERVLTSLCAPLRERVTSGRPQGAEPTVGLSATMKTNTFCSVSVMYLVQLPQEPSTQTEVYLYNPAHPITRICWSNLSRLTRGYLRKDPFTCRVIRLDSEAGTLPNEIGSNKKKQSELICCSGEFSVSQKAWPRLGIHHCGKSDSVLILNGL